MERQGLEALAREKATEWRSLLRRYTPQARQILAKVLRDKLRFMPETRRGCKGHRFLGEGTLTTLLTGLVPELSQGMASLMPASWNRIAGWLRQIDGLRSAA
jgi:hypothetical protein